MARYIDIEPILHTLKHEYKDIVAGRYPFNIVVWDIVQIIEKQPTADVVEVVHGEWIGVGRNFYSVVVECSECGTKYDFEPNYCPDCGAKMDGKKVE